VSESARRHAMPRSLSSPSKKPIIMMRKYWPGGSDGRPNLLVIEAGAAGFAEGIETGVVQDLVELLVEGVTGRCGQLAAVPQVLLSLSPLPRAHRHSWVVRSKHFQCCMFGLQTRAVSRNRTIEAPGRAATVSSSSIRAGPRLTLLVSGRRPGCLRNERNDQLRDVMPAASQATLRPLKRCTTNEITAMINRM